MKALILAGGSGTRLWPLSRKNYPKQFLKLSGNRSLLNRTVERLLQVVRPEDIVVMTNCDYKFHVMSDLAPLFDNPTSGNNPQLNSQHSSPDSVFRLILEPAGRNTAPAVALGIKYCIEVLGCPEDEVIFVSPSDHIIRPVERFGEYLTRAAQIAAEGHIVTFGIKPTRAETGYGYIKAKGGEQGANGFFKVERFIEKPDAPTAERYVNEAGYYWNSGVFAFSIATMTKEFEIHAPDIRKMLDLGYEELLSKFGGMPDISIDYAVAEKSGRMAVMPFDLYWNDIGSWDSLYDELEKDENGNIRVGDILTVDVKDTLVIGSRRLVSAIGIEDCLIVDTDDALLVAKKDETQKVREVVDALKKGGRKEASEHTMIYRPWGSYTVLEEGDRYKIKRIVVNPSARLSLQKHFHRSEHWVVVKGTARVIIGDREIFIHENESAYVPKSTLHKLENPGKVPLEIIEVQNGEYVGEDDIVQVDDVYGRHKEQGQG